MNKVDLQHNTVDTGDEVTRTEELNVHGSLKVLRDKINELVEERQMIVDFLKKYVEKHRGEGLLDSVNALEELLELIDEDISQTS